MRCPKCNGASTLEIILKDSGNYPVIAVPEVQRKKLLAKYSHIKAKACVSCGNIFDLTLEEPEKLAPFAGYNGG